MDLYEVNKQAYNQLPAMSNKDMAIAHKKLLTWLKERREFNYFMMLNHELRYFTLYTYGKDMPVPVHLASTIMEIVQTLGELKGIEITDHGMVEFWIVKNNECHMYALFPYDQGVIEV